MVSRQRLADKADAAAERAGQLALRASTAEQRIAQLEAALTRWREKYELEDDGRRFISVPVDVFDAYLPERKE